MRNRIPLTGLSAMAVLALLSGAASGQVVFVCEGEGRSFVVSGVGATGNCHEVVSAETDLHLSSAEPDLADILRQLDRQAARIDRLEILMYGSRVQRPSRAPSTSRSTDDPFDSGGRMRDLNQELRLQLNGLGR